VEINPEPKSKAKGNNIQNSEREKKSQYSKPNSKGNKLKNFAEKDPKDPSHWSK
jgi:hypothetical protein